MAVWPYGRTGAADLERCMTTLRTWQKEAIAAAESALSRREHGVIQAIMGAGKSVVIAELAARAFRAGLHVVVTVPTQELVRQLASSIGEWSGQVVGEWYADRHELWPITVVCQMSIESYEAAWQQKYAGDSAYAFGCRTCACRSRCGGNCLNCHTPLVLMNGPRRLWIADECHRTECDTVLSWDAPSKRIGLTATPWRADMSGTISSFDRLVYEYGAERAFADGHVVKPTLEHPKAGDIDDVVATWIEQVRGRHGGGVVNARSIADADRFASRIGGVAVHSASEQDAVRARLAIAAGEAVVYVDMLAEGFNCPQIRWMALRRAVGSRVRFAQEVGRGLRAYPGKTTCYMLDVWDLWGTHSMDWRAALGEVEGEAVPALQLDWMVDKAGWTPEAGDREPMPPEILSPLRSWLRHQRVQAVFDGRIAAKEIKSRSWRSDPCSRKQLQYLDQLMGGIDPSELDDNMVRRVRIARAALLDCLRRDPADLNGAFRKGDASDLIDVVRGLQ